MFCNILKINYSNSDHGYGEACYNFDQNNETGDDCFDENHASNLFDKVNYNSQGKNVELPNVLNRLIQYHHNKSKDLTDITGLNQKRPALVHKNREKQPISKSIKAIQFKKDVSST